MNIARHFFILITCSYFRAFKCNFNFDIIRVLENGKTGKTKLCLFRNFTFFNPVQELCYFCGILIVLRHHQSGPIPATA